MKIELEAVPMLVGFSVGMVFFLSQRLFAARLPVAEEAGNAPPAKEEEEPAVEDLDDEAWLAARGLSAADLPAAEPSDVDSNASPSNASPSSAKVLMPEKIVEAAGVLAEEPAAEPLPEPVPIEEEEPEKKAAAARPRQQQKQSPTTLELLLIFAALLVLKVVLNRRVSQQEQELQRLEAQQQAPVLPAAAAAGKAVADAPRMPVTLALTRQNTPTQVIDGVIYHRSAYWGTLHVGTPSVPFSVVFDTGSGHLILPSTYCHSEVCRARKRYRAKSSSSAKSINHDGSEVQPYELRDQITVSFGTGEVSGVFMEDRLCVPETGTDDGCMRMRMIAATAMSEDPFEEFTFDGVLGLGLLGLSQGQPFNFLAVAAGALGGENNPHAKTFALFLAHGESKEDGSEITLGGYNKDRLYGDLAWNPVLNPKLGQWMIEIKSLRVGNERISYCNHGCKAIMDTGTSMLAVPSDVIAELFELLEHPSSNMRDCRGPGPQLHFDMEGITLTLDPEDYGHYDVPDDRSQAPSCKAMLMTMDLPEPVGPKLFILGEPVLRKYYTVYDANNDRPKVGLGLAKHTEVASTGSKRLF